MLKKTIALVILFIALPFAFAQQEELTITTYYPSPYGVYNVLRLYPHQEPATSCNSDNDVGKIYYDNIGRPGDLMICEETSQGYRWQARTGLWTRDGNKIYPNQTNWDVGIGTQSVEPGKKLQVDGELLVRTGPSLGTQSQFRNEDVYFWIEPEYTNDSNNYVEIGARDDVGNSKGVRPLAIPGSNVGIGTTSPWAKLHVKGNRPDITNPRLSEIRLGYEGSSPHGELTHYIDSSSRSFFGFTEGPTTPLPEDPGPWLFRVEHEGPTWLAAQGGNVGIGIAVTADPQRKLDLKQSVDDVTGGLGILNAAGTDRLNLFKIGSTGYIYSGGAGDLPLVLNGSSGNVGIGKTPTERLDVNGSIWANGYKTGTPTQTGQTQNVNVRRADNSGSCTISFVNGLFVSTTCP